MDAEVSVVLRLAVWHTEEGRHLVQILDGLYERVLERGLRKRDFLC